MSEMRERNAERIDAYICLILVLSAPGLTTEADVLKEVAGGRRPIFKERDAVEIGIKELLTVDLLRQEGNTLVPTPAALFLDDYLGI